MRNTDRLRIWFHNRWLEVVLLVIFAGLLAWIGQTGYGLIPKPPPTPTPLVGRFDGEVAYRHVLAQMAFGPRPSGSEAHRKTGDYIAKKLKENGWRVEFQEFNYRGINARNIIGKAGQGPVGIVGAHYDTRRLADNDPNPAQRTERVPGANDGASGVAVLLELARALNKAKLSNEVWLVFFDAEDNGRLDGWDFAAGSEYMAANLAVKPQYVIVADMVGDADQQIYKERSSTPELQERLWAIAAQLGYGKQFISEFKYSILDDHTPFLRRGIAAVDIIDFDYPHWHTIQDTTDKVASTSLERVGRVLQAFLEERPFGFPKPEGSDVHQRSK
jgi:hypothetical protein